MSKNIKWNFTKEEQIKCMETLKEHLPVLRAKASISQAKLASMIGVSRQTYSSIESGRKPMSWNIYLALLLFFDYNGLTHQMLREVRAFPERLILSFNNWDEQLEPGSNSIAGIPESITNKLDDQAFHSIKTVVMLEYARCTNVEGDEIIKAFDGVSIKRTLNDIDRKTDYALKNIERKRR